MLFRSRPPCTGSFYTGRGQFGFKPLYISYVTRDPCTESSTAVPASSTEPCHSNVPSSYPVPSSSHPGHSSYPTSLHGPTSASSAPDSCTGPEPSSSTPETVRDLQPEQPPTYHHWDRPLKLEPQKQLWQSLQVPEPGVRGQWTAADIGKKAAILREPLPRGRTLLNNWEEERATQHLDQVPRSHDGSESFFFRYGHQGLLTMQPQSPMSSITSHKDSYPIPRHVCQPLRGKREAMMEILLHQQIW